MQITRIALDLAKRVIQVHAVDRSGRKVVGKALKRTEVLPFFRELPPCEVGMEACSSAHHWARQLVEYGIVVTTGRMKLRQAIPCLLEDAENRLSLDFRHLLADLYDDLVALDERIERLTGQIESQVCQNEDAQRLLKIPGVGPLTASALITAVGDASQFSNGRQMAVFLGLTPRQHSSGGKTKLPGIHKRGDSYLRGLLVHGARAVLRTASNKTARIAWAVLARHEPYRGSAV